MPNGCPVTLQASVTIRLLPTRWKIILNFKINFKIDFATKILSKSLEFLFNMWNSTSIFNFNFWISCLKFDFWIFIRFCKVIVQEHHDDGSVSKHENKTKSRTGTFNPEFQDSKFMWENLSIAGGMPKVEFIAYHSENDSANLVRKKSKLNFEWKCFILN